MKSLEENVQLFTAQRTPTHRYASFDYCFNYFQSCRDEPKALLGENLEQSCNQLGFYLASWGMLRGSTFLIQHSMKHFVPVIERIATAPRGLWELDINQYDSAGIELLLEWSQKIQDSLLSDGPLKRSATDTLVTKVMLGVFGCVPAFDRNFTRGFEVGRYNAKSLQKVGDYYQEHATQIDALRQPTIDFATGHRTARLYTRAKVLDMAFFSAGAQSDDSRIPWDTRHFGCETLNLEPDRHSKSARAQSDGSAPRAWSASDSTSFVHRGGSVARPRDEQLVACP